MRKTGAKICEKDKERKRRRGKKREKRERKGRERIGKGVSL